MSDPRSLFGPLGTPAPEPKSNAIACAVDLTCGELVNRHKQLREVWLAWISNWHSSPSQKKVLVATGQMFGTGKTTFGLNLLNWNNVHVHTEFQKLPTSDGKEALSTALTVYIDLQKEIFSIFSAGVQNVSEYVSLLIWANSMHQLFGVGIDAAVMFWKQSDSPTIRTVTGVMDMLGKLTQRAFYFHFDEVNALESSELRQLFDSAEGKETSVLSRYYAFWSALSNILDVAFVYVSGKTVMISELGCGKLGHGSSPSRCLQLLLPRLSSSDIKNVIKVKYATAFGSFSDEEHVQRIAEYIHHWSSGIPRNIEYTIKFILSLPDAAEFLRSYDSAAQTTKMLREGGSRETDASESVLIDMDDKVLSNLINTVPGLAPDLRLLSETERNLFAPVLYACACELSFDTNFVFSDDLNALAISEVFSIYTTPSESRSGAVTFILPLAWKYYMKTNGSSCRHLPFDMIRDVNPYIVAKGDAFEELTIGMVLMHSAFSHRGIIRFLSETGSCFSNRDLSDLRTSSIYRLKHKVYNGSNCIDLLNRATDSTFIAKSVRADDFVDFTILYKLVSGEQIRRCIGFQCKAEKANIGLKTVKEEIAKFAVFVATSRSIPNLSPAENSSTTALFVIVMSGQGTREVEDLRGVVWDSASEQELVQQLEIPVGLQVLILSKSQVIQLLLAANLENIWKL